MSCSRIDDGILVVGDAFVDVCAGPLPSLPTWGSNTISPMPIVALPGGSAINVASWLHRLRGKTKVYTGIGQDEFGHVLRRHCAGLGLPLLEAPIPASAASAPTGVCINLAGSGDRSFCSHFGIADEFDTSALSETVLRSHGLKHVHVAGFFSCGALRKSLPSFLLRASALGLTTSLDTNNDASGRWGAVEGLWDEVCGPSEASSFTDAIGDSRTSWTALQRPH